MRTNTGWILLIVLGLILVLGIPALFMMSGLWQGGYWGMMGNWGHMGRFGYFAWLMMCLVPIGLVILVAGVVVVLVNVLNKSSRNITTLPEKNCPNCSKPVQENWSNCPYCGTPLKQ